MQVQVTYDAKASPAMFTKLQVWVDDVVAAEKLGGFEASAGTEIFTIDLTSYGVGPHTLMAQGHQPAKKGVVTTKSATVAFSVTAAAATDKKPLAASTEKFIAETFTPAGFEGTSSKTEETADGRSFKVEAIVKFNPNGAVNLSKDTQKLIQSVTCSVGGSVTIGLNAPIDSQYDADQMFPRDSILAINENKFGSCVFDSNPNDDKSTAFIDADGYLAIQSVTISSTDRRVLTITGTPTSFLFLFETAHISVVPVVDSKNRQLVVATGDDDDHQFHRDRSRHLGTYEYHVLEVIGGYPVTLTAEANFAVTLDIGLDIDFSIWDGLRLSVPITFMAAADASLIADFGVGRRTYHDEENLLHLLIYGWGFSIFDFDLRAGFYFNVDFFADYVMEATKTLRVGASFTAGTGMKIYEPWVRGSWDGLSAGVDKHLDNPAWRSLEFIDPSREPGQVASVDMFSGPAPGVSLELLGLAKLFLRQRTGVELRARVNAAGRLPDADCPSCHSFMANAALVMENIQLGLYLRLYIDVPLIPTIDVTVRETYTLPGESRFDLVSVCLGEERFGITCGDSCCATGQFCFLGDECAPPYDPYCDNEMPRCGSDCCGDTRTCSLAEEECVTTPPGALIGGRLPRLIIESVEEFPVGGLIGPGTRVVLAENPLPAHFFAPGPYSCGDSETSHRVHARIVVLDNDGEPIVVSTNCFVPFEGSAKRVFWIPRSTLLPFQNGSLDRVEGFIEFFDNAIGFAHRTNGGVPVIFLEGAIL